MTKDQKANRYTPGRRFDILTFIDGFKKHYVTKTFKSPQECRDFDWTDKSFEERQSPIVKLFTEGWCYYFARILQDAYPGGNLCLLKGYGHIVYLYENKFYDITGELTNPRNKYIPIEYFGELIYDFKKCYTGGGATRAEVLKCVECAKKDGNILTLKDTLVKPMVSVGVNVIEELEEENNGKKIGN